MFLNLVVDNAFEELGGGVRKPCGMVVSDPFLLVVVLVSFLAPSLALADPQVIRGNSVSSMEVIDSMRV
jgi:small nuclear ribonucleoprotein G